MWFVLSTLFVQLVFLVSIFDIHFQSPVVRGIPPHSNPVSSPAKRLVLISADGLRFDTFMGRGNDRKPNAPFLRSAAERGKWGLSSTRVPTESRPGHVAMIAGLYEDPSAVFKGWKENPVEFDSVFNQSHYTYGWGSPDILTMFTKGSKNNVLMHSYQSESEQFTGHNAYKLDEWVFERFERFFSTATHNDTMKAALGRNGTVFFLHLLGLDTNGHTNKPHSMFYHENLRYVDRGIAKVENIVNEFFKDNNTAFVFTSDHGMTDWGSHGAGHSTETETPIVAWGAGIGKSEKAGQRHDVEQADLAPLLAALLGIPFPVNSVGRLPVTYLSDQDMSWKSQAALTNARQLLSSFEALSTRQRERSLHWRFRPFDPLGADSGKGHLKPIEDAIRSGSFDESIRMSLELMKLCLEGFDHFYRYDQFELKFCVTLAFVGWAGILVVQLLQDRLPATKRRKPGERYTLQPVDQIIFALSVIVFVILTAERSPTLYYAYHMLPLVLWWYSLRRMSLLKGIRIRRWHIVWIALLVVGLELLVLGFFHRWFLSVGLCFLSVWPQLNQNDKWRHHEKYRALWTFSCLVLSLFPVLPPVGKHAWPAVVDMGGMILTIMAFWSSLVMHHDRDRTVLITYTITIPITLYVRHSVSDSLLQGQGLPLLEQCLSWALLAMPLTLPLVGPSRVWPRLIGVAITLAPSFLLLSVSYEPIFYAVLLVTLAAWIQLESAVAGDGNRLQPWHQLRRSYFFLFLTLLGFFGLGNLASLNSFDPSSVRCFVTTFSPFTMAGLLLWKVTVPFLAVSSALWAVTHEHRLSSRGLYLMVLLLSSVMAVQFFHWVTSQGSWLDIGTSISHYVIVQSTVLVVMLLRSFVQLLVHGPVYFHRPGRKYDKD